VKGRKRHLLVDTLGLVLAVVVHAANIQDRAGAKLLLNRVRGRFPRLERILVDGAYGGRLVDWVYLHFWWFLETVKRSDRAEGFTVVPQRWVVERTFGWCSLYRRLSKDYEQLPATSEAMVYATMSHVMIKRIAPGTTTRWAAKRTSSVSGHPLRTNPIMPEM
jgi:putative transposase